MMKRLISIMLSVVMLLSVTPLMSFADNSDSFSLDVSDYTNSELDLTQYTWDDIMDMSPEEYSQFLKAFERVYDPFGTYEEKGTESETQLDSLSGEPQISPQWTSGWVVLGEYVSEGTHEYITAVAVNILIEDKGEIGLTPAEVLYYGLTVSLASIEPDRNIGEAVAANSRHFYNPHTGKNYLGSSADTAKTNAVSRFASARSYISQNNIEESLRQLGWALHYLQDVCVPHHAANITVANLSHGDFEDFAFDHMESYIGSYHSIQSSYYSTALSNSCAQLVHSAALEAYPRAEYVNDKDDQSHWPNQARACLRSAACYSAMLLYKYVQEPGVPFVPN